MGGGKGYGDILVKQESLVENPWKVLLLNAP